MRKLKKLGIGLCMGAIAAAMMATPVCAKGSDEYDTENYHYNDYYDYYAGEDAYEYDLPSYTQPAPYGANFVYFSDDKKEDYRLTNEICEQCRVTEDNIDSLYIDTAIKMEAKEAIENHQYVYDLRSMLEYGISFQMKDDENNAFNYGIIITDEKFYGSSHYMKICKCSMSDYEDKFFYNNHREMNENEYFYTQEDDYGYCTYSFNPKSNVLTIDEYDY